jgi:hypothetical protein
MIGILFGLVGLGVIAVATYRALRLARQTQGRLGTRTRRVAGMDNPAVTHRRRWLERTAAEGENQIRMASVQGPARP